MYWKPLINLRRESEITGFDCSTSRKIEHAAQSPCERSLMKSIEKEDPTLKSARMENYSLAKGSLRGFQKTVVYFFTEIQLANTAFMGGMGGG